jgi:hypothetical protein
LNEIVKKMVWFKLDDDQEKAFKLLKERMISAPLLTLTLQKLLRLSVMPQI